jgi:dual specificity tyrosine-phosphorylation-regulated kinase 2/3/4
MWSFGCILAELFTGFPLFPGENEAEQLALMMELKGIPPDYILEMSQRKANFFDEENQPMIKPNSRGKKRVPGSKDIVSALECDDIQFIQFLEVVKYVILLGMLRMGS